jgi:hypothetical protein
VVVHHRISIVLRTTSKHPRPYITCQPPNTPTPTVLRASLHELELARALHRVGALQQGSFSYRRIPSVSSRASNTNTTTAREPCADHLFSLHTEGTRAMSVSIMCSAPSCANSAMRKSSSSCRSYVTCSSQSTTSPWPWRNS